MMLSYVRSPPPQMAVATGFSYLPVIFFLSCPANWLFLFLFFFCPSRPLSASSGPYLMCCADHSAADAMRPSVSTGYLLGSVNSPPYLPPSPASCSAPLALSVSGATHIHQSSSGSASLAVCFCRFSVPLGRLFRFNL